MASQAKKNYRLLVVALFLGLAVFFYIFKPAVVDKFALQFEDIKFTVRTLLGLAPSGDSNMVIVTVDEKSVNRLGRWPWDRRVIGDLLASLGQADIVGLDIVFSEATEPAKDAYLAEKITGNNIILGFFFRDQASKVTTREDIDLIQDCSYFSFESLDEKIGVKEFRFSEINIPVLAKSALSCAFFNTDPDPDGLYRRYPLAYVHQGYIFPPLAIQMLRYRLNQDASIVFDRRGVKSFRLGKVSLAMTNDIRLNFYDTASVAVVSAVDVLEGQTPPEFFQGKTVLVGVTEIGVFDMRPTPVNPVTPGVLLHYSAILNLLQNEMLHDAPWLDRVLIVVFLLLVLLISYHSKLWQRLVLYFAVSLTIVLLAYYFFIVHLLWLREFYILTPVLLTIAALENLAFSQTLVRAGELKKAFSSYVSPEIVQEILKHPDRLGLGGEEREVSILFSDIRKFTTLSEKVSPQQLVRILTSIHDPMTQIVLGNKGMLDKYIGDAMMALFNTPLDVVDHPSRAVATGLGMIKALEAINPELLEQGLPAIDIGVGINTGRCVVGNMGSRVRFEYTAIGDAVNLASRLEGLCKVYGTKIIISEYTRARLSGDFLVRRLDRVQVKGKSIPVEIYEVMACTDQGREIRDRFEEGLRCYFAGEFVRALPMFVELGDRMHDPAACVFVERCRFFMQEPPPVAWDGVFVPQAK